MSDMTLVEALQRSYLGRLGERVLDRAMLGENLSRDWGPAVPVARNFITNPRMLGSGVWAEVRRNHIWRPRPSITGAVGWRTATGGIVHAQDPRGLKITNTTTVTQGNAWAAYPAEAECPVSAAGDLWSWSCQVTNIGTSSVTVAAQIRNNTTAQQVVGGSVVLAPGETKPLTYTGWAAGAGVLYATVRGVSLPAGSEIVMLDEPLFEKVSGILPTFHGGKLPAGISRPEDFRTRWLGPVNASISVLEGETVTGAAAYGPMVGIRTTLPGGESGLRVIRTGAGTSYVRVGVSAGMSGETTGIIECVSYAGAVPQASALYDGALNVRSQTLLPQGVGEQRGTTSAAGWDAARWIVVRVGTGLWDEAIYRMPAIVPGAYTGPAFHGGMPPLGRYSYAWESTPDASPSIRSAYP